MPAYRGADPVFHQIRNQEKIAGVTIHKVDEGADTGEIVLEEKILLQPSDTYGLLSEKLAQVAGKLTATLIKILSVGFSAPSKPQDETRAHYYKKQSLQEVAINWNKMDADSIIALINACNPYNKGAAAKINNKIIGLLHAEKYDDDLDSSQPAGTILSIDDESMDIAVMNGQLLKVSFIHIDEEFLTPFYLKQLGLTKGMIFENIF